MTVPRFLVCDCHDEPERVFVLHTQFPKFLAEAHEVDGGIIELTPILWMDPQVFQKIGEGARLMREMGDWYYEEIRSWD